MAALTKRSKSVAFEGDLDFNSRHEVAARLPDPQTVDGVVIDLSRVGYVDSAILGLFIGFRKRFMAFGGDPQRLVLVAPCGSGVRKVIEIAGLHRVFTVTGAAPES